MNFEWTEALKMLRDTVRPLAEEKIATLAEEWNRKSYFPYKEAVKPTGELDVFGTGIHDKTGGNALG